MPADSHYVVLWWQTLLSGQRPDAWNWKNISSANNRYASGLPRTSGDAAIGVAAQLPLNIDSDLRIQYTPNGLLHYTNTWRQAHLRRTDTLLEQSLFTDGWQTSSSALSVEWHSLDLDYVIRARSWLEVSIGIQRHALRFRAATQTQGDIQVWGSSLGIPDETESFTQIWKDDQFYSSSQGFYAGSGWTARIGVEAGPFSWIIRNALSFPLSGYYTMDQKLPWFLHARSLQYDISADNALDRIRTGEIQSHNFYTEKPLQGTLPLSQTWILRVNQLFSVEYTYQSESYRVTMIPDTSLSELEADLRSGVQTKVHIPHTALIHYRGKSGGMSGGFFLLNDMWNIVFSGSLFWKIQPLFIQTQLDLLPWVRLFCGVSYAL